MIVSESALREWAKLPERNQIIEDLTMLGLEVDGVKPVAGQFNNVVIGEVIACEKHPNADKLRVTKVNVGNEILDIVCGAPNCRLGLKVCVAKVGAILPGDFKITPAKLRGEPSNGMLCSYAELGVDIESNGIIELPVDAPLGIDVKDYLKLDDVIIDIGLTANRADCLSQLGVSRDLAAKYNVDINYNQFKTDLFSHNRTTIDDKVEVELIDTEACPAYACRVIKNVDTKKTTPIWMVQYLARMGVRSIDPIVDITNYVLHSLGYPMHAFDRDLVTERLVIRKAKDQEKITLLSGDIATLSDNTLVIADTEKAIAMAGIFGGLDKSINDNTKNILLEAAFFNPLAIVNRARQYGLHTDSSHRFERGVDPQTLQVAMELATKLVLEICGGEAGPVNLVGKLPENIYTINLNHSLIERIAGISFEAKTVIDILTSLGCTVEHDAANEKYTVQSPSWRWDLSIPEDLAEEVIRIYGYEKIPTHAPQTSLRMPTHSEKNLPLSRVKDVLINRNFQEIVTYSFVDPKLQGLFHPNEKTLDLPNPISIEMSQMRLSLFTGLLTTLSYNLKRQQKQIRIFETGLTFIPNEEEALGVTQDLELAGLITGTRELENWQSSKDNVDFYFTKGIVEDILSLTIGNKLNQITYQPSSHPGFHPGQTADILLNGEFVGLIGKLHPNLEKPFGVRGDVFLFSLKQKAIKETSVPDVNLPSKFPSNKRDISLIVDDSLNVGNLIYEIKNSNIELLQDVQLFDIFNDQALGENKKSIAITLTIGSSERTLEEQEISDVVSIIVTNLANKFNAVLREV